MRRTFSTLAVFFASMALAAPIAAQTGGLPDKPELVLDIEEGSFHVFLGWKTPSLVGADGKMKPLLEPETPTTTKAGRREPLAVTHAWYPTPDWTQVEYDDTYWPRSRGPVVVQQPERFGHLYAPGHPAEWNVVLLRGRFEVTDPKRVAMAKVNLRYYGGAVVYVNGKELQRGHLPKGAIAFEVPADPYPPEAYLRPDGFLYGWKDNQDRHLIERQEVRVRTIPGKGWLDAVAIPNAVLRKGTNVVAIEVHAAPLSELAVTGKLRPGAWMEQPCTWPHAGVVEAKVTVGAPSGLVQNVAPTSGVRVSNDHPWETLRAHDYAFPQDAPRAISLVGARNGTFSGRVVVSSREDIRGLKATVSALATADGGNKIAVEDLRVRYAEPCAPQITWRRWPLFDRLLDAAPESAPAVPMKIRGRDLQPVPTALVPVWVGVRVPAEAAPGDYQGQLTIQAEGLTPAVQVPIRLKVHDFRLPDPKDFRLTHNIYQSPDSLARYYQVPLWSEKHFELMGKSLALIAGMGSRVLPCPLTVDSPHFRNSESLVRWVKQADGSFTYDFTNFEKYLDLYAKIVGKPRCIAINTVSQEKEGTPTQPLPVTVVDAATGQMSTMLQPAVGTEEDLKFWRPILTELRQRLEKRGWFDVAMIRHVSYCWSPTKETMGTIKTIWPDAKWVSSCHGYRGEFGGMPVLTTEWVWGDWSLYNPESVNARKREYPRPWLKTRAGRPNTDHCILRGGFRDNHPQSAYRWIPEATMLMGLHGVGQQGADFFPLPGPRPREFIHICDGAGGLGIDINVISYLAPGPDGPVTTERAETFREGVQLAETVAFLRQVVDDRKVAPDLARQIEAHLDDRARHLCRVGWQQENQWLGYESAGWHERDDRLFALAAAASEK